MTRKCDLTTKHRLEDVLFLIQYLGLGQHYRLEKGGEMDGPRSSNSWELLARDHPEFFRVMESGSVTLSLRYYQREMDGSNPQPLELELVQQLVQNAFALHERQAKRSELWKIWGTFIAAMVAAVSGIAQIALHFYP